MDKKIIVTILFSLVLVIGTTYLFTRNSGDETPARAIGTPPESIRPARNTTTVSGALVFDEPSTENPGDQGNVRNQPAYLWSATTTRAGERTIGVDYVMVFDGEEAIEAQREDGQCTEESECQTGQYIRNNNAHHRTFALSTTTPVTIEVNGVLKTALQEDRTTITFDELQTILPTLPAFTTKNDVPFKEAKTFVYLDIIGGAVTAIREP